MKDLKSAVLSDIQRHAGLVAKNADKYVALLMKSSESKSNTEKAVNRKELDKCKKRLGEISTLIQKLYENMVFELITQERFAEMSQNLEAENVELKKRSAELENALTDYDKKSSNVDSFAKLIQEYIDITELDAELIHTLIEKIVVHEKEEVDGETVREIDIYYRFIGNVGQCEGGINAT